MWRASPDPPRRAHAALVLPECSAMTTWPASARGLSRRGRETRKRLVFVSCAFDEQRASRPVAATRASSAARGECPESRVKRVAGISSSGPPGPLTVAIAGESLCPPLAAEERGQVPTGGTPDAPRRARRRGFPPRRG